MMPRLSAFAVLAVIAFAQLASSASAQTPVVSDASARQVTALAGTIVWVSGTPGQRQTLWQRTSSGARRVTGSAPARFYRSIDLGRDRRGSLVLTYLRCASVSRCAVRRDDLYGRRASLPGLVPRGCSLSTAPALWRSRAAYGLACTTGNRFDARRSGVHVKTGSRSPRRMPPPRDAVRFGASEVSSVDLRGRRVASILSDIYAFAVSQDVDGTAIRSFLAAASEGESDQHAVGLGLGAGDVLWSLTDAEHAGDPLEAVINRLTGDCREFQVLTSAPDEKTFPAVDLAVDGRAVYLVVPGAGIIRHEFAADTPCR